MPLCVSSYALACPDVDPAALAWLDKMSRSLQQVSYQGVVTLQQGSDMQVMQVARLVGQQSSSEQLTQLTGQGARVERQAHPLNCVHPGHELLRMNLSVTSDECGIAGQYRFAVGKEERVAGRQAISIRIAPRDVYRFGYVMALDMETGLPLRTETIGRGDKVLEKFQFANLTFSQDNLPRAAADLTHQARHPHTGEQSTAQLSPALEIAANQAAIWSVAWLPAGFTLTDVPTKQSGRRTYTDGLAVFSVFLESLDRAIRPGEGLVRRGGTTTYTRGMRRSGSPILVTVIGEVPVNTARMVADSVHWAP